MEHHFSKIIINHILMRKIYNKKLNTTLKFLMTQSIHFIKQNLMIYLTFLHKIFKQE